jgi:hypothetical protein
LADDDPDLVLLGADDASEDTVVPASVSSAADAVSAVAAVGSGTTEGVVWLGAWLGALLAAMGATARGVERADLAPTDADADDATAAGVSSEVLGFCAGAWVAMAA